MRRSLTALTLVVVLLIACGGQSTSAPQSAAPSGVGGAPSASPSVGTTGQTASLTPVASPTPIPSPTVKQLAAAYLKAVTALSKALDKVPAAWKKPPQTLTNAKRVARAYAAAELAFIRAVEAIPWYGEYKTLARRVLTYENQVYVYDQSAAVAKTVADLNYNATRATTAGEKVSAASNELRIALGLPPVPIK